jgi:invasion protein IalB
VGVPSGPVREREAAERAAGLQEAVVAVRVRWEPVLEAAEAEAVAVAAEAEVEAQREPAAVQGAGPKAVAAWPVSCPEPATFPQCDGITASRPGRA